MSLRSWIGHFCPSCREKNTVQNNRVLVLRTACIAGLPAILPCMPPCPAPALSSAKATCGEPRKTKCSPQAAVSKKNFSNAASSANIRCKFCRCAKGEVPWARESGRKCSDRLSFCKYKFQFLAPAERQKAKQALIDKLQDEDQLQEWVEEGEYAEWKRTKHNEGHGRRRTRDSNTVVSMDSTEGFTAQEIRGILWPIAQYKAKFGEPHMDIIEDLSFPSGKKRGVVLEDDGGPLPVGCIRLFNQFESKSVTRQRIADSDDMLASDCKQQMDMARAAARKQVLSGVRPTAKAAGSTSSTKHVPSEPAAAAAAEQDSAKKKQRPSKRKPQQPSDASSGDSDLNFGTHLCWTPASGRTHAGASAASAASGGSGSKPRPPKAGRPASDNGTPDKAKEAQDPQGKKRPAGGGGLGGLDWKMRAAKSRKLIQVEKVKLEATQVIRLFEQDETCSSVSNRTVAKAIDKITVWCSGELQQYFRDEYGGVSTEGEDLQSCLVTLRGRLEALRDVLTGLNSIATEDATTASALQDLSSALTVARSIGLAVPDSVLAKALRKHVEMLVQWRDWRAVKNMLKRSTICPLLSSQSQSGDTGDDELRNQRFQEELIAAVFTKCLWEKDDKGPLKACAGVLEELGAANFAEEMFHQITTIGLCLQDFNMDSMEVILKARDKLKGDAKLFRTFGNLPMGIKIIAAIDNAQLEFLATRSKAQALDKLIAACEVQVPSLLSASCRHLVVNGCARLRKDFAAVLINVPDKFKLANADKINKLQDWLSQGLKHMGSLEYCNFDASLSAAFQKLIGCTSSATDDETMQRVEEYEKALESLKAAMPSSLDLGVAKLGPATVVAQYDASLANRVAFLSKALHLGALVFQSHTPVMQQRPLDSDAVLDICKVIEEFGCPEQWWSQFTWDGTAVAQGPGQAAWDAWQRLMTTAVESLRSWLKMTGNFVALKKDMVTIHKLFQRWVKCAIELPKPAEAASAADPVATEGGSSPAEWLKKLAPANCRGAILGISDASLLDIQQRLDDLKRVVDIAWPRNFMAASPFTLAIGGDEKKHKTGLLLAQLLVPMASLVKSVLLLEARTSVPAAVSLQELEEAKKDIESYLATFHAAASALEQLIAKAKSGDAATHAQVECVLDRRFEVVLAAIRQYSCREVAARMTAMWLKSLQAPLEALKEVLQELDSVYKEPRPITTQVADIMSGAMPDPEWWRNIRRCPQMKKVFGLYTSLREAIAAGSFLQQQFQVDTFNVVKENDKSGTADVMDKLMGICTVTQAVSKKLAQDETRDAVLVGAPKFWLDRQLALPSGLADMIRRSIS